VNKQNFRYWSEENPHQLHEQPLHSDRVTVWCAISSHDIIGPYFLEHDNGSITTVISGSYANIVPTFVTDLATGFPEVNKTCWFQQDGMMSHVARASVDTIQLIFYNCIISRNGDIPWPSRLPHLSACDIFIGLLKKQSLHSLPTQYWRTERKNSWRNCWNLFRDGTPRHGKHSWNIRGMPVQRQGLPQGYHLQEINSMLCAIRRHICNLINWIFLHN
jgi:hypothetical protein